MDNTRLQRKLGSAKGALRCSWAPAVLAAVLFSSQVEAGSVIVSTTHGPVRGYTDTFRQKQVQIFLGIPYAKPPEGELRYQKPQLPERWNEVYDATAVKDSCMQERVPWVFHIPTPLSEDCLYLNVWTPNASEKKKLPVLVWFHGGIFKIGSTYETRYNPTVLSALNDVVVVTCNFRLNMFGFLDLESKGAPGNVGLWDQIFVLRWVQRNILAFGGNPDLVTVFGESSGAMAIHLILLSPYYSGLFQRIFLMSGSQNTNTDVESVCKSIERGDQVSRVLHCAGPFSDATTHPEDVVHCLRQKRSVEISAATENVTTPKLLEFIPTFRTEFLPYLPSVAVEKGHFRPVDAMISVTANEGAFAFVMQPDTDLLQNDLSAYEPSALKSSLTDILWSWLQDEIFPLGRSYLDAASTSNNSALRQRAADFLGNHYFYCPTRFFCESHSAKGGKVYPFVFGHRSRMSPVPGWIWNTHMQDIPYVFGIPFLEEANYTDEDREFSEYMMKTVVSFAKSGSPIPPDGMQQWPQFSAANPNFLWLEPGNYRVLKNFADARCELWRNFL
ncbi:hypothetical protein V5799_000177 [Amblyomma americanum]|uniref:Carboxylic ester hydrolase n=1 Tax=Amblyomma americanum TaxID=6943 RepID=A0AAQ4D3T0_AMBAM